MTANDVLSQISITTALLALAAFGAFGAMFCRVRQLTLEAHTPVFWLFYVSMASAMGWVGMDALFFGRVSASNVFTVVGVWCLLRISYQGWEDGPPKTARRRLN